MKSEPIGLVFSARKGNNWDFASFLLPQWSIFPLGLMDMKPCSGCDYECLGGQECPINDGVSIIYSAWKKANRIIMFLPVYDGRPPALFYILFERLPGLWKRSEEGFKFFQKDIVLIVTGNQGVDQTLTISTQILTNYGCNVILSVAIKPSDYAIGGGVCGGLIQNPELKTTLDQLKSLL